MNVRLCRGQRIAADSTGGRVYHRILVPVDRSAFSENALPFAVALARRSGGTIHLVTVHSGFWPDTVRPAPVVMEAGFDSMLIREEQEYVQALARSLGADHGVSTTATLLEGAVAPALTRCIREVGIDIIVMSTHGHGGLKRAWLGSTADRLLRRLRVPALLIRPRDSITPVEPPRDFSNVLIAMDASPIARNALEAASQLPFSPNARCTLLRIAHAPIMPNSPYIPDTARENREELEARTREASDYLESVASDAIAHWATVDRHVIAAYRVADTILDEADEIGADVIALGTHGRTYLGRAVLGSVADKVIRGASIPILVFPARAARVDATAAGGSAFAGASHH